MSVAVVLFMVLAAAVVTLPPAFALLVALCAVLAGAVLHVRRERVIRRKREHHRHVLEQVQEGLNHMPGHWAVWDDDDRIVACNQLYRELHCPAFERFGDHPRYADAMRITAERVTDDPDEIEAWVESHVEAQRNADGTPSDRSYPDGTWIRVTKHRTPSGGVIGYGADVTELKQREQALEDSEQRYFALTESAPVGIWQFDESGSTVYANPVFRRLLGANESVSADIDAHIPFDRLSRENTGEDMRTWLVEGDEVRQTEARLHGVDGSVRFLLVVRSHALVDRQIGRSFVVTAVDITERRKAEQEAEYLARNDRLTGLANRTAFVEAVEGMVEQHEEGQEFGVILVDLDEFKDVNDTFGHEAGDKLLAQAGKRIKETIGTRGLAARQGGDEFAVVVAPPTDRDEVIEMARKVSARVATGYAIDGRRLHVGGSAGVAMFPQHGWNVEEILRDADIALYNSKSRHDGSVTCFEPQMAVTISEGKKLEEELRGALDSGDLELTYQPQFDLDRRTIVGFEALARWYNPRVGDHIPPDVFFPIAERSGLIFELEAWVLHTACWQARTWLEAGHEWTMVAVNLSPVEFRRGYAASLVKSALQETGFPPERLEIEITEQILLDEVHYDRQGLPELRSAGVRVAIDDFGQGNAAIGALRLMPLDRLKLHKAFIAGSTPDEGEHTVAAAIVSVGRDFQLDIVAQGIESQQHVEYAQRLGCTQGQGRHFCPPARTEELEHLLHDS